MTLRYGQQFAIAQMRFAVADMRSLLDRFFVLTMTRMRQLVFPKNRQDLESARPSERNAQNSWERRAATVLTPTTCSSMRRRLFYFSKPAWSYESRTSR